MKKLRIALAGNANVGKSVIFNHLTGMHQHIGNWPGKTVEKAEGSFRFRSYEIDVIDLPGIYSLSAFSPEELISREYIAKEKPDVVINVIDASALERNLFLTLQLLELNAPLVIALNMMDDAKKKGIEIDSKKLSKLLGVPVVETIATRGVGITQLIEEAVKATKKKRKQFQPTYSKPVEDAVRSLTPFIKELPYPERWVALKLLEGDSETEKLVSTKTLLLARKLRKKLESCQGELCSIIITSEKYVLARKIIEKCQKIKTPEKPSIESRLDEVLLHRVFGYILLLLISILIFASVFTFGDALSQLLSNSLNSLKPLIMELLGNGMLGEIVWGGFFEGVIAALVIAIPYLIPFFFILSLLESSGYLARMAFLMDTLMHKVGLHGKAFIPLLLGYGCNVPACLGCRILENERERSIAGFLVTLVPCAARTVVILSLVGAYLGFQWALAIYAFNLLTIFLLGRIAFKVLPGEPMGLIMEIPPYRMPSLESVVKETWGRLQDFVFMAFPIIIASTFLIKLLELLGVINSLSSLLSPVTVGWLGLPEAVGITLIFGILRKELTIIMLASLLGTQNFANVLTPLQMIVFTLVTLFYIPCAATIGALVKEFGWRRAVFITIFEIAFAILLGGVAFRMLGVLLSWV
ncbi:MAG: ferrous iron transport protein B [Candidatus Micrarchaeia archaeon]